MSATSKPSADPSPTASLSPSQRENETAATIRAHLRWGWWSLLIFLSLGVALEAFHGFKADFYLNVSLETRRLMWTLAHAHGTLLGLVNIAFAATLRSVPQWDERSRGLASGCLKAASLLLPAGFFLGGIKVYGGDPGLGIVLVPVGALLLFVTVFLTARSLAAEPAASSSFAPPPSPETGGRKSGRK